MKKELLASENSFRNCRKTGTDRYLYPSIPTPAPNTQVLYCTPFSVCNWYESSPSPATNPTWLIEVNEQRDLFCFEFSIFCACNTLKRIKEYDVNTIFFNIKWN